MKHTIKKSAVVFLSLVVATGVVAGFRYGIGAPEQVNAGVTDNFTGFAWSDMPTTSNEISNPSGQTVGRGAGWISFNSTDTGSSVNYGVTVDPAGNISGNAWSEHVGWISFNNVSGCPAGNCQPRIETIGGNKIFKGWARAMSYTDANAGGWDGWISFSSANHNGSLSYGWTLNTAGNVSGYAWGGDVLGWIVPQGLQVNLNLQSPTLTLTATPSSVTAGNQITQLTYQSATGTIYNSCTFTTSPAVSGLNGKVLNTSGPTSIYGNNFTLPTTSNQAIASVPVVAPSTTYTLTCIPNVAPTTTVVRTATVVVTTPQAAATLIGPSCVKTSGTAAQLVWTSQNVTSCSINKGVGVLSTLNGNQSVIVTNSLPYTITCNGSYGTATASHTIAIDPNCVQTTGPGGTGGTGGIPIFEEI